MKFENNRILFSAVVAVLFTFCACAKHTTHDDSIVARVGDIAISARDFRIDYELAPANPGNSHNPVQNKKKAHLQSLIDKKLLTIAGLQHGLDQQEDVQRLLKWYEKQSVIQELYRTVVHNQVSVNEDEIRDAYVFLNEKLSVRQLVFKTEKKAVDVYHRLQKGESFGQVAMELADSETQLKYLLTPREFTWGELDERLETAMFGLNKNEVSAPIKTRVGYHLVQLLDRKENLLLTEYGYQERHHYVETILRRRQEARLARQYARALMESVHPKANGPVLLELTKRAKEAIKSDDRGARIPPYFQVRKVRPFMKDLLDKKLVVFEGGFWTVGDFLDRVKVAHPEARPDLTNPQTLTVALSVMVRDEFLAQEGYKRHLEESRSVREEVKRIRDEVVAMRMRSAVLDTLKVSSQEVEQFYANNLARYQIPEMVKIREVMVRNFPLADSLYQAIQKGANLAALARKFSVRKWAAKKGGEMRYFASGAFGNVGKKAFTLRIGELSKPVAVKLDTFTVGYSVFKLIARKPQQTPDLQRIYDKVSKDALQTKRRLVLNGFLANVKKRNPVTVDESVLSSIKTSDELGLGRPMDLLKVSRL
ncbi:MAG: peptidylprolyl isomerase [bacterium]